MGFLLEQGQKAVGLWGEWVRKGWLSTIIRARLSSSTRVFSWHWTQLSLGQGPYTELCVTLAPSRVLGGRPTLTLWKEEERGE